MCDLRLPTFLELDLLFSKHMFYNYRVENFTYCFIGKSWTERKIPMNLYIINSIRTNNFNDDSMMEKINTLWKEAYAGMDDHEGNVYGVYHSYDSNYKGDYTLSVATEDAVGSHVLTFAEDAAYKVFKVNSSDEQGVVKAWMNIWEQEEAGLLQRAYSFDYEKYAPNGEVEIYIALRPV